MRTVYTDNNATTRVAPEVLETMLPLLSEHYGNPSSMHSFGAAAGQAVATARDQVLALLGAAAMGGFLVLQRQRLLHARKQPLDAALRV